MLHFGKNLIKSVHKGTLEDKIPQAPSFLALWQQTGGEAQSRPSLCRAEAPLTGGQEWEGWGSGAEAQIPMHSLILMQFQLSNTYEACQEHSYFELEAIRSEGSFCSFIMWITFYNVART